MKANLELNLLSPKEIYLSFWDSNGDNHIVCKVENDKLFLVDFDQDEPEIKLGQFIQMIKERVKK